VKLRILQIIDVSDRAGASRAAAGLSGSAVKQLCLLAKGLPRDQFEVHVCALNGGPPEADLNFAGVPFTALGKCRKYDLKTFWQLKRLINRLQPEVIHAWSFTANAYGLAAAKAAGAGRFVAAYRSFDHAKTGAQLAIHRYIGKHSRQLAANSCVVRDFYVQKGLPAEKFPVIPDGVEPPQPSTATRRQLLAQLGLPENSRLIGLITDLLPRSRVKDAIWAADLLKVIRRDAHLLVIGDGPHFGRLRLFRDQVRIADLVHFPGRCNEVARWLPHFDMLWSTSPSETQYAAILDAMAAGVPVVAGDVPLLSDLIVHRQTGLLAPVGDRTAFAGAAHQLLEDPALARRLGQAGKDHVLREFTVERMVALHVEMYYNVLERRSTSAG
jgi:glycosyltransferase involved in cell wall biosynthesis